ncbi:uncharacterized protein LOC113236601 isoform X2 [Hyposmocoma kahamanoa]|uniref:uncharacterized protein LOC113236601 isoform X2 n=1 Tax=Hyposmocoma kahamanoa TaxID=1477025 RepID=UPI000E6D7207|nr:uncharacterized protein LOC113236601 isoform X2 [Hyposmocoma kahamanoa]
MYKKIFFIVLITFIVFNTADTRKTRKTKRTKSDEDSTPQPNVVTYSTFGFNDVGNYDGFVPSSPDYTSYMSNYNQDSSKRLYAPAFPTAQDVTGFNSQSQNNQPYNTADDSNPQASTLHFSQMSLYPQPNFDSESQIQSFASEQVQFAPNQGDSSNPIYGAKLSSRSRNKLNFSDYSVFSNVSPNTSEGTFSTSFEVKTTHESKPQQSYGEQHKNYQNSYKYPPTYAPTATDNFKTTQSSLNFPRVVDFTKFKQYYPTDLENKFSTGTINPTNPYDSLPRDQSENSYSNFDDLDIKLTTSSSAFKDPFKKDIEPVTEKEYLKPNNLESEYSQNYFGYQNKNPFRDSKGNIDYKDKFKYNPWTFVNYTNDFKNWKNPIKGYQYATNYSNMNFAFDLSGSKNFPGAEEIDPKKTMNNDEVIPASSNVVDLASYQFPETDYSSFKKVPGYKGEEYTDLFEALKPQGYKYDPVEYVRNLYGTNLPKTTTQWGNVYKTSEYSPYKQRGKKPQFGEEYADEVVHIPRRPYGNKYNFGKYSEAKPNEWASYGRPYKSKKPQNEWANEYSTKFKSEEDLLGLRTHDTSNPSYLPSYRPFTNDLSSDYDYKKLVDKWRQSYMKAKYKNAGLHDFESFASEQKPMHVPIPKPYAVPVPVVKPYPVSIPQIRPVFHHTRPREEDPIDDEDDDYLPRPETSKKVPYAKRPRGRSRIRPRRLSRPTYSDRNRRRWPARKPEPTFKPKYATRLPKDFHTQPFRYHEDDVFDHDHTDYIIYCKRTGNC